MELSVNARLSTMHAGNFVYMPGSQEVYEHSQASFMLDNFI